MNGDHPEERESLFDVTPARRRTYLTAFVLLSLVGYGVVIWHHVTNGASATCGNATGQACMAANAMSIMLGFAIAHAAALGLALTTAEITGGTMVIADWLRAKYVKPLQEKNEAIRRERIAQEEAARERQRAEGRAEGRAEVIREWREWNRRRMEAEERGEEFAEPEPYQGEE